MSTRVATLDDLAAVHALVERAYRGEDARRGWTHEADLLDGQRTDHEALRAVIESAAQVLLLGDDDGRLVGCVQIADEGQGLSYVGMLSVDPDAQAMGLGKKLLAAAERHARDAYKALRIELTVIGRRRELVAYYERRGYRLTGEQRPFPLDDSRFGLPRARDLDFVVMVKTLV